MHVIERDALTALFVALRQRAFRLLGPTVRDGAIVYDELASPADLPQGWTDTQDGGTYRLVRRNDAALFGYAVGPHSWKQFLHPPTVRLWQAQRDGQSFHIRAEQPEQARFAFIGVRSCELHAIAIHDRIFLHDAYVDPVYRARRENLFIVAVNCGQAGGTCFCVSMHTGPKVTQGFDLALTELLTGERHYFVVETGTARGAEVLQDIPHRAATAAEEEAAAAVVARTATQMGRTLHTAGLQELLYRNIEHPRWDEVASRCLTCGNCTMVCPTCFCTTVTDTTDLTGAHAERWRQWDSCFTTDFSYIHGGSVRTSARSRYRHWLMHKLATWIDQFGTSGCVGCGRCITWCPVAIDITAEVDAIRTSEHRAAAEGKNDANA
ncbi:MAG: 4Fe-4S dicluster domain-containing protein [Candidatus Binatia bacterium]|nr:4Fe-4S dicluster domain-containing protein [Candidatus Binatia bacterium]